MKLSQGQTLCILMSQGTNVQDVDLIVHNQRRPSRLKIYAFCETFFK